MVQEKLQAPKSFSSHLYHLQSWGSGGLRGETAMLPENAKWARSRVTLNQMSLHLVFIESWNHSQRAVCLVPNYHLLTRKSLSTWDTLLASNILNWIIEALAWPTEQTAVRVRFGELHFTECFQLDDAKNWVCGCIGTLLAGEEIGKDYSVVWMVSTMLAHKCTWRLKTWCPEPTQTAYVTISCTETQGQYTEGNILFDVISSFISDVGSINHW